MLCIEFLWIPHETTNAKASLVDLGTQWEKIARKMKPLITFNYSKLLWPFKFLVIVDALLHTNMPQISINTAT